MDNSAIYLIALLSKMASSRKLFGRSLMVYRDILTCNIFTTKIYSSIDRNGYLWA